MLSFGGSIFCSFFFRESNNKKRKNKRDRKSVKMNDSIEETLTRNPDAIFVHEDGLKLSSIEAEEIVGRGALDKISFAWLSIFRRDVL